MFKSIADIKRKMVIGSIWHTMWKCRGSIKDMGRREVSVNRASSFGFKNPKTGETSWCDWPKKSEVIFHSDKSFTIVHGEIELTYTFITE